MTRTGFSVRLAQHLAEPFITLHPDDAQQNGIANADIVRASSPHGEVLLRALISDRQVPGQVFAPMHWSDQFASQARVGSLISAHVDPFSSQPASKMQRVSIDPYAATSFAYGVTSGRPALREQLPDSYWALAPVDNGWQFEVASRLCVDELRQQLLALLTKHANGSHHPEKFIESDDVHSENHRLGIYNSNDRLQALLYLSAQPVVASRSWARQQLDLSVKPPSKRWHLLAGAASADQPDKGAIVCSCYSVGVTQIEQALAEGLCSDVAGVGKQLQAGTNCGSCRSEIQSIVQYSAQTLKRKCTTSPSRSR
jgi:assimilatory nitrate reductase catalytic subunit